MKKCDECQYWRGFASEISGRCGVVVQPEIINKFNGKEEQKLFLLNIDANKTGECPHYKKAWFVFWRLG